MQCLKCGRETKNRDSFCPECLEVMAAAPVKCDTPVILPERDLLQKKTPKKKQPKAEEIIAQLNKTVRRLWIAVAVMAVLFAASFGMLSYVLYLNYNQPTIGSNYNTAATETTMLN